MSRLYMLLMSSGYCDQPQCVFAEVCLYGLVVGNACDDSVLDELAVWVEVLVCREFLMSGDLLSLLGIACYVDDEFQHLEI